MYCTRFLAISLSCFVTFVFSHSHSSSHSHHDQKPFQSSPETTSPLPLATRAYWMRRAIQALSDLSSPCPFEAFGAAIVNHTSTSTSPLGSLVCIGVNAISQTGNPTLHGEIAAINNCTAILSNPSGPYGGLSPSEVSAAWKDLSLYTTAEACPMCATAIRYAGFKEYVFATSIDFLIETGWRQVKISSREVFRQSWLLGTETEFVGDVLANETDHLFSWQFQKDKPCPNGCERDGEDGGCTAV